MESGAWNDIALKCGFPELSIRGEIDQIWSGPPKKNMDTEPIKKLHPGAIKTASKSAGSEAPKLQNYEKRSREHESRLEIICIQVPTV